MREIFEISISKKLEQQHKHDEIRKKDHNQIVFDFIFFDKSQNKYF
jgi:hypothetical protein